MGEIRREGGDREQERAREGRGDRDGRGRELVRMTHGRGRRARQACAGYEGPRNMGWLVSNPPPHRDARGGHRWCFVLPQRHGIVSPARWRRCSRVRHLRKGMLVKVTGRGKCLTESLYGGGRTWLRHG